MKNVRRLILILSSLIAAWVLISFGGAMVDSGNAAFWSNSLMWSLLSCLIVMPALVMVNHASSRASKRARKARAQKQAGQERKQKKREREEQGSFVQEESSEARTLWPEPEQEGQWPPKESVEEQKRSIHA